MRERLTQLLERTASVYQAAEQRCRLFQDAFMHWERNLQATRGPLELQLTALQHQLDRLLRSWREGLLEKYTAQLRSMTTAAGASLDSLKHEGHRLESAIVHMGDTLPAGHSLRSLVGSLHEALIAYCAEVERRESDEQDQMDANLIGSLVTEAWMQTALHAPVEELWEAPEEVA